MRRVFRCTLRTVREDGPYNKCLPCVKGGFIASPGGKLSNRKESAVRLMRNAGCNVGQFSTAEPMPVLNNGKGPRRCAVFLCFSRIPHPTFARESSACKAHLLPGRRYSPAPFTQGGLIAATAPCHPERSAAESKNLNSKDFIGCSAIPAGG